MRMTPLRTVTNRDSRTFTVRILPPGARYGQQNTMITDTPTVEFYDATYACDDADDLSFGPLGQLVTRYDMAAIEYGITGIVLDSNVPEWRIDDHTAHDVRAWLETWQRATWRALADRLRRAVDRQRTIDDATARVIAHYYAFGPGTASRVFATTGAVADPGAVSSEILSGVHITEAGVAAAHGMRKYLSAVGTRDAVPGWSHLWLE